LLAALLAACFTPQAPRTPRVAEGAKLAVALPQRPDVSAEAGRRFWADAASGARYEILRALPGDWFELATPRGPLRARWELLERQDHASLRDLPALLAHAEAAGLALADLELRGDPLVGAHLHGPSVRVIREGVLRLGPKSRELARSAAAAREAAVERLEQSVVAAVSAIDDSKLGAPALGALAEILAQIPLEDSKTSFDDAPPGFVRRLVRNGWPPGGVIPKDVLEDLQAAVLDAEKLRPDLRFEGGGASWVRTRDALGHEVWLLSTPERSAYARTASTPAYFYDVKPALLVVRLPAGSVPLADSARWTSAEIWSDQGRIARWSDGALESDPARWRAAYPLGTATADPGQLADALPPHIAVLEPDGDVLALVTAYGVLTPAPSGQKEVAERFYRDAARVLPDAAHLDLLGQHLLVYTYDSPDTRHPDLLGTRKLAGDIHQTARQTLNTQAGGTYRGDCDDLSELYLQIAHHQGRNAHMIGLPAHAALAWAEPGGAGWRTYVLQTGQPRMFEAATLRASLEQAYRSFGAGEVIDFTKLEVLLRFSGENTRQSWYLSQRIFSDPAYARAMIDVQRNWHFQTYQRAIEKMQRMIDAGDTDPANYSELSGLYHYTGLYSQSADALAPAIAGTESSQTRVSLSTDRMLELYRAGRSEEAHALAVDLRERQIPALEREMDKALVDPRLTLADALLDPHAEAGLALEILAQDVAPQVDSLIGEIAGALAADGGLVKLWNEGAVDPVRYQLRWFVSTAVNALYRTRSGALASHPARAALMASAQLWIDGVGFHDIDSTESVLSRYAVVGRFYEALGNPPDLEKRLRAAPPPADAGVDHTRRGSGPEQIERDVPWIAATPTYWAADLAEEFAEDHPRADAALAIDRADRVLEARRRLVKLGLDSAEFDASERAARVLRALIARRPDELRAVVRDVRDGNDRRERLELASWIAAAARSLPLDWYGQVMEIYRRELNYKPMYFWIAWSAAVLGAEPQALLTARMAVREFPDDEDFAAEYAYMRRRFGGRGAH
jgi:tetratricopeptide (TPR) repeat protein